MENNGKYERVFIGLGGNMGDVEQAFRGALQKLETGRDVEGQSDVHIERVSPMYKTAPYRKGPDPELQPAYLNACAEIRTVLPARALLARLQDIEKFFGRARREKWGPRTLDLDILFFGDSIIRDAAIDAFDTVLHRPGLVIPHPDLQNRRFVLQPLFEIAPDFPHPLLKKTVRQLLQECSDTGTVELLHPLS